MRMFARLNPKKLFLIDSMGALVSAAMLGIVLPKFQSHIGMPLPTLRTLAILALLFFLYSMICYLKFPIKWQVYLRFIAVVNLLYCLLTGALVISFFENLTLLGKLYFIIEIAIILGLVLIELKRSFNDERQTN